MPVVSVLMNEIWLIAIVWNFARFVNNNLYFGLPHASIKLTFLKVFFEDCCSGGNSGESTDCSVKDFTARITQLRSEYFVLGEGRWPYLWRALSCLCKGTKGKKNVFLVTCPQKWWVGMSGFFLLFILYEFDFGYIYIMYMNMEMYT